MEAVDYKYRYRFERPKDISFEQWDKMRFEVQEELPWLIVSAGFGDDEYDEQRQHMLMHETCRRLGINCYSRYKNDEGGTKGR